MQTIYVFGNKNHETDKKAFEVAEKLMVDFPNINFINIQPNQDIPVSNTTLIMLDTISGITKPLLLDDSNLENITLNKSSTVHDYDLGFQLKYLNKLGKIHKFFIIGIPLQKDLVKKDYDFIHSTVKKLVAHDIQGS